MSYASVQNQRAMALDLRRNQAYYDALKKIITPESVVLDVGAGLGVLGILAAQLGAKRVYLVEPEDVILVTKEIVSKNGYGDRISCLQGTIEDVKLPERVDIIISVFTGNFLIEEDLLPSLFYARDHYLKSDGIMLPNAAIMEAVPIFAPEVYQKYVECWSQHHLGIDNSPARNYVTQAIHYFNQELRKGKYLAEPEKLLEMDFTCQNNTHCEVTTTQKITKSGICHGWAGWFKMRLGDKWLSTAPHAPKLHWSSAFLPLDPPLKFDIEEEVTFKLQRPPFGDWSWQVEARGISQQRSTFFATPLSLKKIKQFSPQYQPKLNQKGQAAKFVLSHTDGSMTVEEITKHLVKEYPNLFKETRKATNFVRNLVSNFS